MTFLTLFCLFSGSQVSMSIVNEDGGGDFRIHLPSSFTFKLQSVDLVKVKSIRTKKINKKTTRVLEAMGLPVEGADKLRQKILLSRSIKKSNCTISKNTGTSGSIRRF